MRFNIKLTLIQKANIIPINFQYPLSASLYGIISKGDAAYADFLHETGYGKGFKLFTFSQLNCRFKIEGDRMRILGEELSFEVSFHLPAAMESFIKGLFNSQTITIADKKSKATFNIKSVESLPNPLQGHKENEIVNIRLKPLSPVVAGLHNQKGNYNFLPPDDGKFTESLIYNWRNKIATCYDEQTASSALLMMELVPMRQPFKSRLITIKSDTPQETKIRGWMNFELNTTGEKRFLELLVDAGAGIYNAMGCGFCEPLPIAKNQSE